MGRDCPFPGRVLPLFKVICVRLDILCLQHEPGIFQDCLAHLQQSHSKGNKVTGMSSLLPALTCAGYRALDNEKQASFLLQIFLQFKCSSVKRREKINNKAYSLDVF